MIIHCAQCGKHIDYQGSWFDSLSRSRICSKACLDKIQRAYALLILRKEGRPARLR